MTLGRPRRGGDAQKILRHFARLGRRDAQDAPDGQRESAAGGEVRLRDADDARTRADANNAAAAARRRLPKEPK